ncbi:MAG: hypothetical protein COV46_06110 [Deltaproteobacteria bacterium CG11_big_fil_rev_8_21_14_0_20_49_13]|nr:MAG: hypothetical protein COV46_06110 [Deltaproteobacteria bacterium CG11_big_fil_rev_8_21_14_0_20_49_13]
MLKPKAFGVTCAIFWSIVVAWSVLMGLVGKGTGAYDCMSSFYLKWFDLSWTGLVIGAALGFVDGLIFGLLFAWVYNKIAGKSAA